MQCQEGINWVLINQKQISHFNGDVEGDRNVFLGEPYVPPGWHCEVIILPAYCHWVVEYWKTDESFGVCSYFLFLYFNALQDVRQTHGLFYFSFSSHSISKWSLISRWVDMEQTSTLSAEITYIKVTNCIQHAKGSGDFKAWKSNSLPKFFLNKEIWLSWDYFVQ